MTAERFSVGDVLLIPVSRDAYVPVKVAFLSRRYKGLVLLLAAPEAITKTIGLPNPLPTVWPVQISSVRSSLKAPWSPKVIGSWRLVGRDETPIPPEATRRNVAQSILEEDRVIRPATEDDTARFVTEWGKVSMQDWLRPGRIPVQGGATEASIQRFLQKLLGIDPGPTPPHIATGPTPAAPVPPLRVSSDQDNRLWEIIDASWQAVAPALAKKRPGIARKVSSKDLKAVDTALTKKVVPAIRKALEELPRVELVAMDRVLEHALYEIDRQEVQEHTDGSDDGFLYARGWIVGMGKAFYDAVNADPSKAISDMEEEKITYLPAEVFEERFGEKIPSSGISRETGSNKKGWS